MSDIGVTSVRRSALAWTLAGVVFIDLVLVLVSGVSAMGISNRVIQQLSLAYENNAAVWWSSATLLIAGLLFFESAFTHVKHRAALLCIALLLTLLSLDEMGSLHERIFTGSYLSYVPYGLAGAAIFLFGFWRLYRDESTRPLAILLFIGFSCYGTVVVQEFFEHNVDWPEWALGLRVGVEEGTELAGTFLCLLVAGRFLNLDKTTLLEIPRHIGRSRALLSSIVCVFLLSAAYAAFRSPSLEGYPGRGNPSLWFAMAAFLMLAFEQFRGNDFWTVLRSKTSLAITVLAVLASLAQTMFVYQRFPISWLVIANTVLFIALALVLLSAFKQSLVSVLVASVPAAVLALLALNGSDAAAFAMAIYSGAALLTVYLLATSVVESSQVGVRNPSLR